MGRVTLGEPRRFKSPMPKKTRSLKNELRVVQTFYGDGSTSKQPKSRKTKTPKGGISVQETANPGQAPQAEMAQKSGKPLPRVPKKVHAAKFSPNVTFADILDDAATAASDSEIHTESASVADTATYDRRSRFGC
eukprot:SAG11_NODE_1106_length_5841_cov_44.770986_4_plen_135_part_00